MGLRLLTAVFLLMHYIKKLLGQRVQLLFVDLISEGKLQFVKFFITTLLHQYHNTAGKLHALIDKRLG